MKSATVAVGMAVLAINSHQSSGFAPKIPLTASTKSSTPRTVLYGYLDDLSKDLRAPDSNPIPDEESREATVMAKDKLDRAGPGDWASYVEFNEVRGRD